LCVVDLDSKFLKVSKSWERLLGYSADELVNRSFQDFIHPDNVASTLEARQKVTKGENLFRFVNRYRSKEGSYHYLEWTSTIKVNQS
jgi:PAS domain S-box-containing protein